MSDVINLMDVRQIMDQLPHRYPFLLIDRVVEFEKGESLTALKNVTVNEPIFQGHFPGAPIFPGVLIIEALAQATGVLAFKTVGSTPEDGKLYFLAGVDKARFRKPVVPGDQMLLKAEVITNKRNLWKFKAVASVDSKEVASAEIMCAESSV